MPTKTCQQFLYRNVCLSVWHSLCSCQFQFPESENYSRSNTSWTQSAENIFSIDHPMKYLSSPIAAVYQLLWTFVVCIRFLDSSQSGSENLLTDQELFQPILSNPGRVWMKMWKEILSNLLTKEKSWMLACECAPARLDQFRQVVASSRCTQHCG